MLGNYLTFNDISFPNPINTSKTSKTLENVNQSEAGTDLVCVIRASKLYWGMSFNLTSAKKEILEQLCQDESTVMTYMGKTYTVRVRNYKEKLVEGSEWLSSIDGLFECSVDVTEY
jgi:hypothetical protein